MASDKEFPTNREIFEIARFWAKFGYYDVPYDQLVWAIGEHLKYQTIEVIRVKDEVVGFSRWNINGSIATILDCVIRPDYRRKNIMKLMLIRGWKRFPEATTIEFERGIKDNKQRRISMIKLLGVHNGRK